VHRNNSLAVMAAATFAYFAAVMQRSSMGVGALDAAERFQTSATALSGLAVTQLAVYAMLQIPVGVLLDRFGARSLIIFGSISMMFGQFVVGFAQNITVAYAGRMLVGMGDAFIFISMVRLIVAWNAPKLVARRQQFLTSLGQLGQIASATLFAFLLASVGWQSAFSISASIVALAAVSAAFFVFNEPKRIAEVRNDITLRVAVNQFFENLKFAGTRMSFWIHFTLQSSGSVFALLWGVPYLVEGQGQSLSFASAMIVMQTLLGLVFGFVLGWIASAHPEWRVSTVYVVATAIIVAWLVMLLWPGFAPSWLLTILVGIIAIGGPASMYSMDFSRQFTSSERLGAANGFINVGGFLATFSTMAIAGFTLDLVQRISNAESPFTPEGFRWAMASQILVVSLGLAFFAFELKKTRKTHRI
jgi:MFS family permease